MRLEAPGRARGSSPCRAARPPDAHTAPSIDRTPAENSKLLQKIKVTIKVIKLLSQLYQSYDQSYWLRARPMRTLLLRQIVHLPEVRIKVTSVRNSCESHYETRARPVRTLLLRQVVHLPKIRSYYRKSKFLSKLYQSYYQSYWLRVTRPPDAHTDPSTSPTPGNSYESYSGNSYESNFTDWVILAMLQHLVSHFYTAPLINRTPAGNSSESYYSSYESYYEMIMEVTANFIRNSYESCNEIRVESYY